MNKILSWFTAHATLKNLILSIMVLIPFNLFLFPYLTGKIRDLSGGVGTLDITLGYLPETARQMIETYTPVGRNLYILTEWTADLFYPLVYTVLFSLLLAIVYKHAFASDSPFQYLRWSPLIMMVFDYLENTSVTILLAIYPRFPLPLAIFASFASLMKWVLGFTAGIGLITGCVSLLLRLITSRKNQGA